MSPTNLTHQITTSLGSRILAFSWRNADKTLERHAKGPLTPKSACPGVSTTLSTWCLQVSRVTLLMMVMPRSRSRSLLAKRGLYRKRDTGAKNEGVTCSLGLEEIFVGAPQDGTDDFGLEGTMMTIKWIAAKPSQTLYLSLVKQPVNPAIRSGRVASLEKLIYQSGFPMIWRGRGVYFAFMYAEVVTSDHAERHTSQRLVEKGCSLYI